MPQLALLIGCPRSGTTMTLDILAAHEAFGWVSQRYNKRPDLTWLAHHNRLLDFPYVRNLTSQNRRFRAQFKVVPYAVEPWSFWEEHLKSFRWERFGPVPPRRRTKDDISPEEIETIRRALDHLCRSQNKSHVLSKYTDFPRMVYLSQAFPEAKFIHIVRDGRAVAWSYYQKIHHDVWGNWREREWWIQGWPEDWRQEWQREYNDQLSFATYMWKFFLDEIWKDAAQIEPGRYLEIRYSDMVRNPGHALEQMLSFLGLRMSGRIASYLQNVPLEDMNVKWRRDVSQEQSQMFEAVIAEERFRNCLDLD